MTTITFPAVEGIHAGEFIVQEAEGFVSREAITIGGSAVVAAGTVLGKVITATGTATAGTNTGNGVMGAITVGDGAKAGTYTLKVTKAATNAGDFEVTDPDGDVVGVGSVAAAFAGGGLSFTLADGATDFVVGDSFTIAVAISATVYKPLSLTATDGTERAVAVSFDRYDATSANVSGVGIVRMAAINGRMLTWPAGITAAQQAAATARLAENHVIIRN